MTISDFIVVFAILVAPILAVTATRHSDEQKETRRRKLEIFKTLMATRAYRTSLDHVQALNRIDLEFGTRKPREKEVIDAWKQYLDHLGTDQSSSSDWDQRSTDLFVNMLHAMGRVVGYDFDKTHIKNAAYAPIAHGTIEQEQKLLRQAFIQVLDGSRALPFYYVNPATGKPEITGP